jgi:hypothetical protein
MLPSKIDLDKMSLRDLQSKLLDCSPGSDMWNLVWPAYEIKRSSADRRRTWLCFAVSTAIALAALWGHYRKNGVVEAERFVLKNDKGETRGGMVVTSQGPGLEFYDSNGTLRLNLSIFNDMPSLTIKDARGTGVAVLADVPTGPGLMLYDRNGGTARNSTSERRVRGCTWRIRTDLPRP